MNFANRREVIGTSAHWLQTGPRRYGFALITVAVATLLRYPVSKLLGPSLPFLLFYPAIWLVAWMAGLGPGVFAVFLCAASASYVFFGPVNLAALGLPRNANGLMLFSVVGVAISVLADVCRRRSERLRDFIASATDSIITVDQQQRIVLFNAAAEKMFRCPEAEALGQPLERFIPQRFHASHSGHVRKFGESGVTNRAMGALDSLWALRADGEEFQIEASISKIEFGRTKRFTAIIRDITERKHAEAALREYARVVECLEEMILVADRQYRYMIANRAFLNFRGMSAEEVLGHSAHEVLGNDLFATQVKEKMDECFLGNVVHHEMTYNLSNLGNRDLSVSYFPIEGPAGVDRIACVLQDITDQKLAVEALLKSEERFSKAFRNNPLAITISTEAEGRYLDVNDAFLKLLGYESGDVIGHTAAELRFWGEPLDRMEMLRQLRNDRQVARHQARYRTSKGEVREAEVWAESIELDGQPCVLAITRDITEVQQLEAQFRQAQKMEAVGRLAAGVAHDFNNVMSIIMGYSDLLLGLIAPESPMSRYVSETKKAAKRAALLTQQLLAFSRKQVVFPKLLDLNDVVHSSTSMLLQLVGEDIEIEFRPTTPLGSIQADPGQIEQVLMNLAVNARDAMPAGGKIIIETGEAELDEDYASRHPGSEAGQHVVLVVSDTGCGMDENIKSQIFEPFFTTKAVGQGTGLGLSTVYGIVKQSEGYILVYSETGKGTTFKIYFPKLREKAEALVLSPEVAEPPRGSETILVVEDDKTLREVTVKLLQDGGYRVVEAKDAEDALGIMASSQPEIDLLLTDVVMLGTSGVELVRRAEEGHPNLRSLFMSGYTGDLVGRQGVLIEEVYFLEKPFTRKSLLVKVYAALHSESARQQ
jgi:PAS domain S-box-containing protein